MRKMALLFLTIACLGLTSCSNSANEPKGDSQSAKVKTKGSGVNDIKIATLPTPDGWTAKPSGGGYSVLDLYPADGDQQNPQEKITIEVGSPLDSNVRNTAKVYVEAFRHTQSGKGSYKELPFKVDGETAFRALLRSDKTDLIPRQCIVVHHGGKFCIIIANAKANKDDTAVLDQIAKSLKWK